MGATWTAPGNTIRGCSDPAPIGATQHGTAHPLWTPYAVTRDSALVNSPLSAESLFGRRVRSWLPSRVPCSGSSARGFIAI